MPNTYKPTMIAERMDGKPIERKTDAIRKARSEVRLLPLGKDWIVESYDHEACAWRQSPPMQWGIARGTRKRMRMTRAYEYMEYDRYEAEFMVAEKPL